MFYNPECKLALEPHQELLLKAADVMDKCGHCVDVFQDKDGHVCLRGALHIAFDGNPYEIYNGLRGPTFELAELAICMVLNRDNISDCADWNNDEATSKDEVVTVLRKAALIA